jgi:hypothetical protein
MKPAKVLLLALWCACVNISPKLFGQCTILTMRSAVHDTLVTGTGNDNYNFTVPQFNPAVGTLVSVVVKTKVSVGYSFQAENTTNGSRSISIGVGRYDYLSSTALSNSNYASSMQKTYGPYTVGKSDGVSNSGPDYIAKGPFSFLSNTIIINDSITSSVANFLGTGVVAFGYYPSTYSTIPQNLTYTFNASDTIHFIVTYYYCNTSTLPTGITDFFATKQNDATVKLSWITQNEEAGRNYDIEKSADGKNFDSISSITSDAAASTANYQYVYLIKNADNGKLFFRLKETGKDGIVSYSEIRSVDLNETGGILKIFPNPATDHINIQLTKTANWQIDIFAAHGGLVQSNFINGGNAVQILFKSKPAPGVYFVRATNLQSLEQQTISVVLH